jgi:hypothetical protein
MIALQRPSLRNRARPEASANESVDALLARFPGRDGITFIRRDNLASRKAHAKMGMTEVASIAHDSVEQLVVVGFSST